MQACCRCVLGMPSSPERCRRSEGSATIRWRKRGSPVRCCGMQGDLTPSGPMQPGTPAPGAASGSMAGPARPDAVLCCALGRPALFLAGAAAGSSGRACSGQGSGCERGLSPAFAARDAAPARLRQPGPTACRLSATPGRFQPGPAEAGTRAGVPPCLLQQQHQPLQQQQLRCAPSQDAGACLTGLAFSSSSTGACLHRQQ